MFATLLSIGAGLFGKAGDALTVASFLTERERIKLDVETEIRKSYNETWDYIHSVQGWEALYDRTRDIALNPRTLNETRCMRRLLKHFAFCHREHRKGLSELPEKITEDVRNCFSYPVRLDAWHDLKRFQDEALVKYVDEILAGTC